MADNGEYARYQYRLLQQKFAADAAARAAARDTGTNPPVRTLVQTQATPSSDPRLTTNPTGGINSVTGEPLNTVAPTRAGVGATDDNTNNNNTSSNTSDADIANSDASYGGATQAEQDAIIKAQQGTVAGAAGTNSRKQIVPRGNILDRFASYTYRASVYLMTSDQYQQLIRSQKKSINGYNLLFQSGGAPASQGGFTGALNTNANDATGGANTINFNAADAGRNPAFPLDFYIDSITISNLSQGQATGISHSATQLKFTVIEPMGITLLDRIYQAVQDQAPKEQGTGKINYTTAQYLMVLRWYGYDIDGNLIKGGPTLSDPNAVVEKFIPFAINGINWSVNSKLVNYDFDCTPIDQYVAGGTRRGAVPYNMQLSGSTVADVLGGTVATQTATAAAPGASTTSSTPDQSGAANAAAAPPKANAAGNPDPAVKVGLMAAMNEHVNQLTTGTRPLYQVADQYEIVFVGAAKQLIGDATIVLPGEKKEANQTPMGTTQTKDAKSASPTTDKKNVTQKIIPAVAGQSIVQLIDKVIRNSSYITSQQLTQINPFGGPTDLDGGGEQPNPEAANKPVNWFRINFEAIPIKPDNLRNDYAYKIRYIISVYKIDKYDSKYFPVGTFRGVHKSYPWWFTGKNTAVLEYQETLNTAYNMLVSGSDTQDSGSETTRKQIAATMQDIVIYTYGPNSGESMQGSKDRGNEASANLADSLYGGADLANSTLKIIGDPAWIQQGSLSGGVTAADLEIGSFLPDGTINFDGEQIMYEVAWNRPDDYDLATGMAAPTSKKNKTKSRVYLATTVTSEFKQGKFEQSISGTLVNLPKPDGSNKAPDASLPIPTNERDERGRATTGFDSRVAATQSSMPTAPQVNVNPSNNSPQTLNTSAPGPNDNASPVPPPQPATSGSGENLDVGDPFVPPGALSGRITADGLDNSPSTPQIISRDY